MIAHIATMASLLPAIYALFAAKTEAKNINKEELISLYVIHCMTAKTVTNLCLGERLGAGISRSQGNVDTYRRNLVGF